MTKGQRAMAVAMLYPEGRKGKKLNNSTIDFDKSYLSNGIRYLTTMENIRLPSVFPYLPLVRFMSELMGRSD